MEKRRLKLRRKELIKMNKKMTFEEAIASLEKIVDEMDSGELSLDESLASFEEAVSLVKYCNAELEKAEQRVRILTENADGSVSDAPFVNSDEN